MAPSLLSLLGELSHEAVEYAVVTCVITVVLALCSALVCINYGRAFTIIVVDVCAVFAIAIPCLAIGFIAFIAILERYSIPVTQNMVRNMLGGGSVLFFVLLVIAFLIDFLLLRSSEEVNSPL